MIRLWLQGCCKVSLTHRQGYRIELSGNALEKSAFAQLKTTSRYIETLIYRCLSRLGSSARMCGLAFVRRSVTLAVTILVSGNCWNSLSVLGQERGISSRYTPMQQFEDRTRYHAPSHYVGVTDNGLLQVQSWLKWLELKELIRQTECAGLASQPIAISGDPPLSIARPCRYLRSLHAVPETRQSRPAAYQRTTLR